MIRHYKTHDGLFSHDKTESSGEDLESTLKDHLSKIGRVEPLLSWWQAEGERILQENNYPLDLQGLWDALQEGEHAPEIHDIRALLFRLDQTRRALFENRLEAAVWSMALAVQHGMKAKIRPFEPDVERGAKYSETQSDRRGKRQTWQGLTRAQREERNAKIWAAFEQTKLTRNSFKIAQGKKHRLSPTQIGNILEEFEKSPTSS